MPTAYQKDGSIFKKLQELFLKSQGLFNEELSSVLITKLCEQDDISALIGKSSPTILQ